MPHSVSRDLLQRPYEPNDFQSQLQSHRLEPYRVSSRPIFSQAEPSRILECSDKPGQMFSQPSWGMHPQHSPSQLLSSLESVHRQADSLKAYREGYLFPAELHFLLRPGPSNTCNRFLNIVIPPEMFHFDGRIRGDLLENVLCGLAVTRLH
ncbi:unnamed protein product [Protopolystoma xenopodis]|uniref:Uncharacterized protein n=1 Tax=Protopolystoma xenopodis TaxID=117903 RepID=A0A3S5FE34_9PLAT|nr:unnamed protein product [Protopolystoma xenopodis]